MNINDIHAVIFDSDGVLVDSETIHIAVERELLAEIGLKYDDEVYLTRFVGLSMPDYYASLADDYFAATGGKFPNEFSVQLHKRVWPRMEAELQPIQGVKGLVSKFEGPVAVASSAPFERLKRKLTIANLFETFDPHIYSVDHVQNGKPSPDLFLYAAEKLGIAPERCMVIEDSVNGILAARKANMLAIGFVGGGHADNGLRTRLTEAGANTVFDNHTEIGALF